MDFIHERNEEFKSGQRVALHPATDHWMRGAKYGIVEGPTFGIKVNVRLDNGNVVREYPRNLAIID